MNGSKAEAPPSVGEALRRLLDGVALLDAERVPLAAALGRVLREEARAGSDQPAFDRSAMDGYAVAGTVETWTSLTLPCIAEIVAGGGAGAPLRPGECVRVLTGAPVPEGTQRVIPQEWTERTGDSVTFRPPSSDAPSFVRRRGDDCREGDLLIATGRRLGPPDLAALAQHGIVTPNVARQPVAVHLATGDELVDAATIPSGSQMRDCNSPLVAALLARAGALCGGQRRVGDDLAPALAALEMIGWRKADLVIVSGGAGRSERDLGRELLRSLGFDPVLSGVDLRPGKPLIAARRDRQWAFILPGNPVSHWVTWNLFVRPLLSKMEGAALETRAVTAILDSDWPAGPDRRPARWPARLFADAEGIWRAKPLALAGSGDISGLAGANSLLYLPPYPVPAGTPVAAEWTD